MTRPTRDETSAARVAEVVLALRARGAELRLADGRFQWRPISLATADDLAVLRAPSGFRAAVTWRMAVMEAQTPPGTAPLPLLTACAPALDGRCPALATEAEEARAAVSAAPGRCALCVVAALLALRSHDDDARRLVSAPTGTCCGQRGPGGPGSPLRLWCGLCPHSPRYWRHGREVPS